MGRGTGCYRKPSIDTRIKYATQTRFSREKPKMTKEECVRLNLHITIIRDGVCAYCGKE